MKIKLTLLALLVLAALFAVNRWLGGKREYIAGVPAASTPASGEVRERFTVGFLPVT